MSDERRREEERAGHAGDREALLKARRDRCRSGQCCAHAPASGEKPKIASLPVLWYENEGGDRWLPPCGELPTPPAGFVYQHSRFAFQLTHNILRLTQAHEVEACEHPEEMVRPTSGWIDGIRGRECRACGGTQTGPEDGPWPGAWDSGGSRRLMAGNMGWSRDLVTELVKHGVEVCDAIVFSAVACEKCLNIALWKVGLPDGYPPDSEEAEKAGTTCELCVPERYVNGE